MNDRIRNRLLDIIKKNFYIDINNDIDDFRTRIYSDSFASYQVNDFDALRFKHNKVNHLVCFGQDLFHKNIVEGLWSKIKRISYDFSGANFKSLADIENKVVMHVNIFIIKFVFLYLSKNVKC